MTSPRKFSEDPEFEVHITVDHTATVRAIDDEDAVSKVWDQITDSGAFNLEVNEIGGDDGAI